MTAELRALADEVHERALAASPFVATFLGVTGYDALVPDLSRAAEDSLTAAMTGLRERLVALGDPAGWDAAGRITHAAVLNTIDGLVAAAGARSLEHSLSAMADGPGALFMVAAQTHLATLEQAADYLTRVGGFPGYLDAQLDRLAEGVAAGRLPVATLRSVAVAQVDGYLHGAGRDVLADVPPPHDGDGGAAWSGQLAALVTDRVRPALARWRDAVAALPVRPDDQCGLVHLPGGAADYERMVALHTTVALTPRQVHELGQQAVVELVADMTRLGEQLGLSGYPAVRDAVRGSGTAVEPEQAMALARDAVRRAESVLAGPFAEPLPPPCAVAAMSEHLGRAGVPPHYTPPRPDGSVGTYWFNAEQPSAGSGWDLETTAFHEAVPGHHLQVARALGLQEIPALQSQGAVTAYEEGWALYAEQLSGELGLFTSVQTQLGALSARLFRAARLVVDSGLHHLGWTRADAIAWLGETVPFPATFVESEVNRYIGVPGQALGYYVGLRELLRLRADAQARLGDRFTLAGFHGAVLDSGSLPLPAVATAVDAWVDSLRR